MVSIFMLFWGGKSKYYNALLRCHRFVESSKFLKKQLVLLPIFSNSKFSETPSRLYQGFFPDHKKQTDQNHSTNFPRNLTAKQCFKSS